MQKNIWYVRREARLVTFRETPECLGWKSILGANVFKILSVSVEVLYV